MVKTTDKKEDHGLQKHDNPRLKLIGRPILPFTLDCNMVVKFH